MLPIIDTAGNSSPTDLTLPTANRSISSPEPSPGTVVTILEIRTPHPAGPAGRERNHQSGRWSGEEVSFAETPLAGEMHSNLWLADTVCRTENQHIHERTFHASQYRSRDFSSCRPWYCRRPPPILEPSGHTPSTETPHNINDSAPLG